MKCPLSSYVQVKDEGETTLEKEDCLKEGCAWWIEDRQSCVVKGIPYELWEIKKQLNVVAEELTLIRPPAK